MCGRFTLHTEKDLLARRFDVGLDELTDFGPHFNIAPSQEVLAVRQSRSAEGQPRVAEQMRWGLVPYWAKPLDRLPSMINARAETAATKPAYRRAYRRRRCLILADGFYEWKASGDKKLPKTPYWIHLESREPFAFAGLWEIWRDPDDRDAPPLITCTILTTAASPSVASIHPRMPVILPRERESAWLDPQLENPNEVAKLLDTSGAAPLISHPVSDRVNAPEHDEATLLDEVPERMPRLF
jgi:putative SOS response-associated peptidase YedK